MTMFPASSLFKYSISAFVGLILFSIPNYSLLGQTKPIQVTFTIQRFPGVVRVEATTPTALKFDLRMNAVVQNQVYPRRQSETYKEVLIQAGTNSVVTEIPIAEEAKDSWCRTSLLIEKNRNAVPDRDDYLSTSLASNQNNYHNLDEHLFVSSSVTSSESQNLTYKGKIQYVTNTSGLGLKNPNQLPNFLTLSQFYEDCGRLTGGSVASSFSFLQTAPEFHSIHPTDFFQNWKSLFSFRTVFISKPDLQIVSNDNKSNTALTHWLTAGGQLIVFDCEKNFTDRDKILSLIEPAADRSSKQRRVWHKPADELLAVKGFAAEPVYGFSSNSGLHSNELPAKWRTATKTFDGTPFLMTDFMQGNVVLVDNGMQKWETKDWRALFNTIHLQGNVGKSVGTSSIGRNFLHSFRLPGIGEAPVRVFQVLIGLFVLLIGPVCYFLFHRSGRMHLLLVSTPLISSVAVFSLLSYAIFSDGFNKRGRVQSLTTIDHQTGLGLTHERHVYYSGVSPRPCECDADTYVIDARSHTSPYTKFQFPDEGRLSISGGQIKARSHFQLTSLRCDEIEQSVTFTKSSADTEQMTLTNGFTSRLICVVYHSKDGWYLANDVEPGTAAAAIRVEKKQATNELCLLVSKPGGMIEHGDGWGDSSEIISKIANQRLDEKTLPVNSYLALIEDCEFVSQPQPDANFEDNKLHVIIGKR